MFARFPASARRFLLEPLTVPRAREIVRERMGQREHNLLRMVEQSIYAYPESPYFKLLRRAGCELGDLRAMIQQKGVEGALRNLRAAGVYVTFEEFKGRKAIVRNEFTLAVTPTDFDNQAARRDFGLTTGGSTGMANAVYHDFDYIAAGAPHHLLMLDTWNVLDVPMLAALPILPGGGVRFLMQRAYGGQYANGWYTPIGWRDSQYWFKYGAATLYMVFWMRMLGAHIPFPKVVKSDQALEIAQWVHNALKQHDRCLVYMVVSHGLRVCVAAQKAGLDLKGATFRVGGEPLTPAKVKQMEQVGVRVLPAYGAIDTGGIGVGCADSDEVGDVHLMHDGFALFPFDHHVPSADVTVPAFNLTTLLDSAPKVMLNYQIDDYGIVKERACGCALGALGYTTHLSNIRSYSKSVGEGVTLVGNELQAILEHDLPQRVGGTLLDYQWIEQEDAQGLTRLYLVISPRIEINSEPEVIQIVLDALRNASPMADAARSVWQQAETIRIIRREPVATARGKVMPLHIQRNDHAQGGPSA